MKRRARDFVLLGRIWAELGSGKIAEGFLTDAKHKELVYGFCHAGQITINPAHATVETIIHECLHRMFPAWTEHGIRRVTTRLKACMTDDEVCALYEEYQHRVHKRKPRVLKK